MKKKYHIKKSTEIERVMKNKRFASSKNIIVYSYKNSETTNFRYALSVGKKVGKAHHRNKIKRRLRDIITNICNKEEIIDIFIIVRPSINNLDYQEIKKELINLFTKLKIKVR